MSDRREVLVSFWLDPATGLASQWNVGAWSPTGEPVALMAHSLPFLFFLHEACDDVLGYLPELETALAALPLRPYPAPHVQPWDQLALF